MIPLPAKCAELLAREAEARGTTPEAIEREAISDQVPPITEGDVDLFLEQQSGLDANDTRVRGRVALFLNMLALLVIATMEPFEDRHKGAMG